MVCWVLRGMMAWIGTKWEDLDARCLSQKSHDLDLRNLPPNDTQADSRTRTVENLFRAKQSDTASTGPLPTKGLPWNPTEPGCTWDNTQLTPLPRNNSKRCHRSTLATTTARNDKIHAGSATSTRQRARLPESELPENPTWHPDPQSRTGNTRIYPPATPAGTQPKSFAPAQKS